MTEQNYETAFNKLFNMYIPENQLSKRADTNWTEITGILNIKGKNFPESYVTAYFYHDPKTYKHTILDIKCINIPKRIIKELFNNEDYNYDLVKNIIDELFEIGQSFGFYKNMSSIKNIRIEESISQYNFGMTELKNVTKLTISDFLKDVRAGSQPIKKMLRQSIRYKCIDNNICPLIELMIPYSNTAYFHTVVHLHPSMKDIQMAKMDELKGYFKSQLEDQLDVVLKRKIKIHENDLRKMSLQEKLNYVPVLEMLTV